MMRIADYLLLVGLACLGVFALLKVGGVLETRELREQSARVERSLEESAPAIDDTDRTAIEEGERADEAAREAEEAVRTAHDLATGSENACRPVPVSCLGSIAPGLRSNADP
jgi:hypothetical protein